MKRHVVIRGFPAPLWNWWGFVQNDGDKVRVGDVATMAGGSMWRSYAVPMDRGKVHVALAVSANTKAVPTAFCRLRVKTQRPLSAPVETVWDISSHRAAPEAHEQGRQARGGLDARQAGDYTGVDVRDLEVDPTDASVVYVADGGDDPGATSCDAGAMGGVWTLVVEDDGSGGVTDPLVDDLTFSTDTGGVAISDTLEATGVSMDPDGQFLLAFVPVGPSAGYAADRIYRILRDDIGTAAWVPINGDAWVPPPDVADETLRDASLNLQGAWLEASTRMKPRVSQNGTQAGYAPGAAFDGVWFWDAYEADLCGGQMYSAALVTNGNMWRVENLDAGCDGSPWDPDADTAWTFWPDPDEPHGRAWQTTAVQDVAWDPQSGDVWTAMSDLGLSVLPYGETSAEVDCLWNALSAGGRDVVVTRDGTVWATFYDQGNGIPHSIGVFRSLHDETLGGAGVAWEYESAAIVGNHQYAHSPDFSANYDYLYCIDQDTSHMATAFGERPGEDDGNAFLDTGAADEEDESAASWASPGASTRSTRTRPWSGSGATRRAA